MKILYSSLLLAFNFFIFSQNVWGQDVSGVWRGKLSQEVGGLYREYDFELQLTQKGNLIQGISKITVDGHFANLSLEGTARGNFIEFKELKIIDQKIKKQAFWCLKKGLLMLSLHKGYEYLQGNWQGWSKEGNCTPGKLWVSRPQLIKVEESLPLIVQEEQASTQKESQEPQTKKEEEPENSLVPSEIQTENTFQGRITRESQLPVEVRQAILTLEVWDHKEIDGDVISLYLNEESILEDYTLTGTRHQIKITLDPSKKDNYLMLYAHNLGEITPNTAAISVDDGTEKQIRILRSDLDQSEVILLKYIPE